MSSDAQLIREAIGVVVDSVIDDAAAAAVQAIRGQVAGYADNPDQALIADLAEHCRNIFGVLAMSLRTGRPAEPEDFPFTSSTAVRRVDQGVSLADFMRAYRLAQASLWEELRARLVADPYLAGHALDVVGNVMQVIEAGSQAAATAYLEAEQHRVADHDRVRRDLIEDLLAGRQPVIAARLALLRALGVGEQTPYVMVSAAVGHPDESGDGVRAAAAAIRRAVGRDGRGLIAMRQGEVVAAFPARVAAGLPEALGRTATALAATGVRLRIGISCEHSGFVAGPLAYQETRIARRGCTGRDRVTALSALSPSDYLTLREDPTARQLIRPELRRFIEDDLSSGGDLIDSVFAYVATDLNAKEAAAQLGVHVNTMYHRLERISERTGCQLRRYRDIEELLTAVRLLAPGAGGTTAGQGCSPADGPTRA